MLASPTCAAQSRQCAAPLDSRRERACDQHRPLAAIPFGTPFAGSVGTRTRTRGVHPACDERVQLSPPSTTPAYHSDRDASRGHVPREMLQCQRHLRSRNSRFRSRCSHLKQSPPQSQDRSVPAPGVAWPSRRVDVHHERVVHGEYSRQPSRLPQHQHHFGEAFPFRGCRRQPPFPRSRLRERRGSAQGVHDVWQEQGWSPNLRRPRRAPRLRAERLRPKTPWRQ